MLCESRCWAGFVASTKGESHERCAYCLYLIYLQEYRAEAHAINKKIVQIAQKCEELRQEGRHNDASMLETQVPHFCKYVLKARFLTRSNAPFDSTATGNALRHIIERFKTIERPCSRVELIDIWYADS